MTTTYNPYKISLALLTNELKDTYDIPLITPDKIPNIKSKLDEGFDTDVLKDWLRDFQKKSHQPKREKPQYSGYEILQCLRQSYFLRQGEAIDKSVIGKYPFSSIKASMGNIVEQLLLSMYNQANGTKYQNDVWVKWPTDKLYGTQFPVLGKIDGLSYDADTILDVKFTDREDVMHQNQVKLYIQAWEDITGKKTFKYGEVIYINSQMNSITKTRFEINDEVREVEFPAMVKRIKYYSDCLVNNVIPEADHKGCTFCPYKQPCIQANMQASDSQDNQRDNNIPNINTNDVTVSYQRGKDKPIESKNPKKSKEDINGPEIKFKQHPKPDNNIKILL